MEMKKIVIQSVKNNSKEYYKKNKNVVIFLCLILCFIIVKTIIAKQKYKKLEEHGVYTIGKYVEYKRYPKSKNYYFEFYYLSKKIKAFEISAPPCFYKNIGKYYVLKYLHEEPEVFKVDFDKEVTDSTEIVNAGFSYP